MSTGTGVLWTGVTAAAFILVLGWCWCDARPGPGRWTRTPTGLVVFAALAGELLLGIVELSGWA